MRVALDVSRSKLPPGFRRRVAFRNSRIRQQVSGCVNYERLWLLGLDVCIEWGGSFDRDRPQWSYRAAKAAKPSPPPRA